MGNSASFTDVGSRNQNVHGQGALDVDLNGVAFQCKALTSSMEHQLAASLSLLERQDEMLIILKDYFNPVSPGPQTRELLAVEQLQRNQATVDQQIKGLKSSGDSLKHIIESFEGGIYPINLKVTSDEILSEKQNVIDSLNKEISSLKNRIQTLETELSDKRQIQRRNEALLSNTTELKQQLESIKRRCGFYETEKEKSTREMDSMRKRNKVLQDEANGLKEQISKLRKQNHLLEQEHTSANRRAEEFRRQVALQQKRKISVPVQLFSPRKGDLAVMVLEEMTSMLETQFAVEEKQLVTGVCEKYSDIRPDQAVLILCINASRLGSDVESALQGLSLNRYQGLIILHHKDTHALPNQPSERLLTSSMSEYKKLGGIFDMAFLSGRGMYPCDMNNRAVTELVSFIKTFSTPE